MAQMPLDPEVPTRHLSIRLLQTDFQELEAAAARSGLGRSALVREGIRHVLALHRERESSAA